MLVSRWKSPLACRAPRAGVLAICCALGTLACGTPEDPARIELRARLKQAAVLSDQDLGRMLDEVGRTVAGKTVRFIQDAVTGELDQTQRDVVLGMLANHVWVYDEGIRSSGNATVRVINAPGLSLYAEYSASRRLLVDVETFLPRRFEFSYEFPGMGDYALDLVIEP